MRFDTSFKGLGLSLDSLARLNFANAEKSKKKCLELCTGYSWCYAVEVTLMEFGDLLPICGLVTDRPTFEKVYGQGQKEYSTFWVCGKLGYVDRY